MAEESTGGHKLMRQHIYEGMRLPGAMSAANLEKCKEFRFKDDVVIVSYPKTGTAWVQEMVWIIAHDGDIEAAKQETVEMRVPFLDMTNMLTKDSYLDIAQSRPRPAVLKTHLPPSFYATQLKEDKAKYIIMVRNPKDALVSLYHFYKSALMMGKFTGTWDEMFDMAIKDELIYGSFFNIYEPWLLLPKNPAFLWVKYEDMHKDLPGELKRIAAFMGKDLSDEKIMALAAHGSFKSMSANDMTNYSVYKMGDAMKSPFMRAGTVGEWKKFFTDEQNQIYDEIYNKRMKAHGLEMDFECN